MIKNKRLFVLLSFIILLISCYEEKENCLDTFAINYDVSADLECMECCTYPEVSFDISHTYETRPYRLSDTFVNNLGSKFKILSQKYYLSDIHLFNKNKKLDLVINENYSLKNGKKFTIAKNYTLIEANIQNNIFANIRYAGTCDSLEFTIGISDFYDEIEKKLLPSNYDISPQSDMIIDDKYASLRLTILAGIDLKDTLRLKVFGENKFKIKLNSLEFIKGKNRNIVLPPFKYDELFKNIIFKKSDEKAIEDKISQNFKNFI